MNIYNQLQLGKKYSKKALAEELNETSLKSVREGVFSCKQSNSYFLFVDLEKAGKESRFHFNDYFEEDFFHWDSQTTQHIDSPKIQEIVNGTIEIHLFVRIVQKVKSVTQSFVYCGRLEYVKHDSSTAKPVHIVFNNIDYDDFTNSEDLIDIYLWKPEKAGMKSSSNLSHKGTVTPKRKSNYKPPATTEREGLVVSRVGQGYFRNQLIQKFDYKCAVTSSGVKAVLIASHIVPWREATETERLDVNNGILLSPLYDALFDKHLISFDNLGKVILSSKLPLEEAKKLGVDLNASITIDSYMESYLIRHRKLIS
jgi:hypothetical protein